MAIYNAALWAGVTAALPVGLPVVLLHEKRRRTVPYRLGLKVPPTGTRHALQGSDDPKPIWVHALSVGETMSAETLVTVLAARYGRRRLIFSAATQTGYATARRLFTDKVSHIDYFPFDLAPCVAAASRRVDPALVVLVESDIWPNFMRIQQRRSVPVVLVNARLSKRTFSGYKRFSIVTRPMLQAFSAVCAQTEADAQRFVALGVAPERLLVSGNLKFDQPLQAPTAMWLGSQRDLLGIKPGRPVVLAGSTHAGEEEIVLDAFRRLLRHYHDLLLVVAPRDPERAPRIVELFQTAGITARTYNQLERRTRDDRPAAVVVDRLGLLRDLYALGDVVFVGGSLVPLGGHNPIEAAAHARPVLFGPHMENFAQISRLFLSSGGAVQVENADQFAQAAQRWLSDPAQAFDSGARARHIVATHGGAVEKTVQRIVETLH
jgi:3-deoxy-D-manno-octulosonic-acid transferase